MYIWEFVIGERYLYHELMKRIIALLLLVGIVYGGWVFYQQSRMPYKSTKPTDISTSTLSLQDNNNTLSNLESVLGESISAGIDVATNLVSTVTNSDAEPVINKALNNFQTELKKLPEDQVKKIQYNYCKGIVNEYEKTNN